MIKDLVVGIFILLLLLGLLGWMTDHGWVSGSVTNPAPSVSQLDTSPSKLNDACTALVAKTGGTCKVIAHDP